MNRFEEKKGNQGLFIYDKLQNKHLSMSDILNLLNVAYSGKTGAYCNNCGNFTIVETEPGNVVCETCGFTDGAKNV